MNLTYGDKIIIKGEKKKRKVITVIGNYVYFGVYGDKINKKYVTKVNI